MLYDAKIVALYKDVLETPDGGEVVYDLIKHKSGGGAGILLVDEEEYTYLVRQYRNSLDAVDLEIPAGGYSFHGESGETCALREAEEETGCHKGKGLIRGCDLCLWTDADAACDQGVCCG